MNKNQEAIRTINARIIELQSESLKLNYKEQLQEKIAKLERISELFEIIKLLQS